MTSRHILLVQGHPDPVTSHLCHALAASYAAGDAGAARKWLVRLRALGRRAE